MYETCSQVEHVEQLAETATEDDSADALTGGVEMLLTEEPSETELAETALDPDDMLADDTALLLVSELCEVNPAEVLDPAGEAADDPELVLIAELCKTESAELVLDPCCIFADDATLLLDTKPLETEPEEPKLFWMKRSRKTMSGPRPRSVMMLKLQREENNARSTTRAES